MNTIMELYNSENGSGIFIQIGAGAGDLDKAANCRDGFTEFIKKQPRENIKKIILVEPNPLNIPLLKECWKEYPQSTIYQLGIVPKIYEKDTMDLYYYPNDGTNYQVASIIKSHIHKHYGDNCTIEKFEIPVKTLESFIHEVLNETEIIEFLALDIEGIDAEVLLDIDFSKIKVKYLSFEHLHLGNQRDPVLQHLMDNNFQYLGSGVDYKGYDWLCINKLYK